MAGDWIKVRSNLHEDPAVGRIAEALNLHPLDVVGRLVRVWSWADAQSRSGHADVTQLYLDTLTSTPGLADAMVLVGWLEVPENGHIVFPKFDRHNGKPAKDRALAKDRQAEKRSRSSHDDVTPASREHRDQRREEKRNTSRTTASKSISTPAPQPTGTASAGQTQPQLAEAIASECARAKMLDPTTDNPILKRWAAQGVTVTQITKALEEARRPGSKPLPEDLRAAYVDAIVTKIVKADAETHAAAQRRIDQTLAANAELRNATVATPPGGSPSAFLATVTGKRRPSKFDDDPDSTPSP